MSLEDWLNEGKIERHSTSPEEIGNLMAVFERDMADAGVETLSTDRRFATAYSAALMMARAALAASGCRTTGEGSHYLTIQSLAFTLGLDKGTITKFDKFRKKRNISDYEMTGMVSGQEVNEITALSKQLYDDVMNWLRAHHPHLVEKV